MPAQTQRFPTSPRTFCRDSWIEGNFIPSLLRESIWVRTLQRVKRPLDPSKPLMNVRANRSLSSRADILAARSIHTLSKASYSQRTDTQHCDNRWKSQHSLFSCQLPSPSPHRGYRSSVKCVVDIPSHKKGCANGIGRYEAHSDQPIRGSKGPPNCNSTVMQQQPCSRRMRLQPKLLLWPAVLCDKGEDFFAGDT